MIQIAAASLAGLMMLFVALKGLRPRAQWRERVYSAAVGGWTALGAAIYYPAVFGRFAPLAWSHNPLLVTVFGFGLVFLGVMAAMSLTNQ